MASRRTPLIVRVLLAAFPSAFPASALSVGPLAPSPALAAAPPVHTLVVSGTGVDTYPAFDPGIERYAVTTTAATGGTLTVDATTTDPAGVIRVDGRVAPGGTATVTGLAEGDEVSVFVEDSAGIEVHAVVYLPAGFPALEVGPAVRALAPGLVGLTLNDISAGRSLRHHAGPPRRTDPRAPDPATAGSSTSRTSRTAASASARRSPLPAPDEGRSWLDDRWQEMRRLRTVGLLNTDLHDSILLPDGSRFLIAYEPRGTDRLDSVIQRIGADGTVGWTWSSQGLEDESLSVPPSGPGARWDYAHMNAMQLVGDDDLLVSFRHLDSVFRIATVDHGAFRPVT